MWQGRNIREARESMDKTELTATDVRCDILVLQQVAEDVSEQAVASPDVHGFA